MCKPQLQRYFYPVSVALSKYLLLLGVYFDNRVEHIKFVDFCGKYRIPLLQYLCSSKCASSPNEDVIKPHRTYLMKKVLLG